MGQATQDSDEEDEDGEEDKNKKASVETDLNEENELKDGAYINLADFEPTGDLTKNKEIPMYHDCRMKYECLETYIGSINPGCGFGEMAMQIDGKNNDRVRNYSAIAM